jgi:hypothetical protein
MDDRQIVREIRIAKLLLGFDANWSKGYSIGAQAAGDLRWGIGEVIRVAAYIAANSGVSEIKRLKGRILRSVPRDIAESGSDSDAVAKAVFRKVKRLGPLGMLGAMAGITEDSNAHGAAGLAYDLTRDMEKVASERVAGDATTEINDAWREMNTALGEMTSFLDSSYSMESYEEWDLNTAILGDALDSAEEAFNAAEDTGDAKVAKRVKAFSDMLNFLHKKSLGISEDYGKARREYRELIEKLGKATDDIGSTVRSLAR